MNQQQCLDGAAGIVTGGGRGIGAAIARELSALGARLVLADLVADGVADVVEGITANGGEAVPVVADVRHYADTERLRDTCLGRFGRIDFSVANASMSDACTLVDGDPEHWRAVVETNVLGVAHTVRAVLPVMREQGDGHMELIASVSGREAYAGEPIYIASAWMETIDPLRDEDVARAVAFVLTQPKHMAINELVLRPIGQEV